MTGFHRHTSPEPAELLPDTVGTARPSKALRAAATADAAAATTRPESRDIHIRAARRRDVPAIAALVEQFARLMLDLGDPTPLRLDASAIEKDGFGRDPAFRGIVAQIDGEVVGYLLYCQGYDSDAACRQLVVVDLFVTLAARRWGIGTRLMDRARRLAVATGAQHMVWTVDQRNTAAIRFYERCGASPVEGSAMMGMSAL